MSERKELAFFLNRWFIGVVMSGYKVAAVLLLMGNLAVSLFADEGNSTALDKVPEIARAPFDAQQARAHQESWARSLRVPVETTNKVGMKLLLIPPGEYLMGSSDAEVDVGLKLAESIDADENTRKRIEGTERPQHRVTITKPFLLGTTEVTIGQFRQFVEATKYVTEAEKYGSANTAVTTKATTPQKEAFDWRWPGYDQVEQDAVSQVTWNDAVVFCNWLSVQEQLVPCYQADAKFVWALQPQATGYRLPTEAEWEFACRAGTTGQYSFGDDLQDLEQHGWFKLKSGSKPSRVVGSKRANPFGLFDMHGNLFEWCEDGFDATWYEKSPQTDPRAPAAPTRVMRSGDWFGNAVRCRSAFRGRGEQTTRSDDVGFRVVRRVGAP